ncbi:hypothetical protein Q5691_26975 [Microcoleus sp. w1-18aA5]|uniref:hypothetical protein n=1 Tax=Microcoleus sp. w1-18aA5 TaxID=2818982 RepID=UPI002FCF04E2
MEDLNSYIEKYIEKAEPYFSHPQTPDSVVSELYLSLFLTPGAFIPPIPPSLVKTIIYPSIFAIRSTTRKSFDFVDCLVVTMMESLDWDIHVMEVAYLLRLNFFRLLVELLGELFSWVTKIDTVADHDRTAIAASRDPPKIFIPIPKIESSSGCARSDSLLLAYF